MDSSSLQQRLRDYTENYWDLVVGILTAGVAFWAHWYGLFTLVVPLAAIAIAVLSLTISEIANIVSERLDEPYGSLVLTISAVTVEIMLLFMLLIQGSDSSIATETVKGGIISTIIVDMNVLLGLALFVGGLSYKEQTHNEDTSQSYTTILLVTALILLVPSILSYTKHSAETIRLASMLIGLLLFLFYIVILIFQTRTHNHYFKPTVKKRTLHYRSNRRLEEEEEEKEYIFEKISNKVNFLIIFGLLLLIGFLAEIFAHDGLKMVNDNNIPIGLAGIIIAVISVMPEVFTAIRAAKNDQIQRVVNIAMGASTVSILITVPILMLLVEFFGGELHLDFNPLQIGALIFTVILAWKTTNEGATDYLKGVAHLLFFVAFAIIATLY
ncbi:MAG: sodium:proton exchanger [Campylobacterales bacterium]